MCVTYKNIYATMLSTTTMGQKIVFLVFLYMGGKKLAQKLRGKSHIIADHDDGPKKYTNLLVGVPTWKGRKFT